MMISCTDSFVPFPKSSMFHLPVKDAGEELFSFGKLFTFILIKVFNYPCGISGQHTISLRETFGNYRSCSYNSEITQFNRGQNDGIHAQPAKLSNADRSGFYVVGII